MALLYKIPLVSNIFGAHQKDVFVALGWRMPQLEFRIPALYKDELVGSTLSTD